MEAADNTLTPSAWGDDFEIGWDEADETAGGDPTPDAMPQSQLLTDAQFNDLIAELFNTCDIPWEAHETAGGDPTPDAMSQSQCLTDAQFNNDLIPELSNPTYDIPWDPMYDFTGLDGILNQYHPQTMELTSPSSSGGITQTPCSGGFDFNSSPGLCQAPYPSPDSLMESPQDCLPGPSQFTPNQLNTSLYIGEGVAPEALSLTPSSGDFYFNSSPGLPQTPYLSPNSLMGSPLAYSAGLSKLTPDQLNSSPDIGEGVASKGLSMAPPSSVNSSAPCQTNRASRKRSRRVKNSPPGMKASGMRARSWRKINRPERCPACPMMRFQYQSDLDKHLVARHPQVAIKHGLSIDRHACEWCPKTFARKDGLMRHLTEKHQRQKTWKKRPQN